MDLDSTVMKIDAWQWHECIKTVINQRKQTERGSQPFGDVKTLLPVESSIKECRFQKPGDDLEQVAQYYCVELVVQE